MDLQEAAKQALDLLHKAEQYEDCDKGQMFQGVWDGDEFGIAMLQLERALDTPETPPEEEQELVRLRAERDELRAALVNLVFTASKLWDDAKPIKDSVAVRVTHPIIEQARAIISRTEGGGVGG